MYIQKRKIVLKRECKNWLHVCVIALLALFVLTFFIAATSAEGGYTYITKWGSCGTGDGQFNLPQSVAVYSSGDVFVVDRQNHRIQKFDSSGGYITKWGSFGTGDGQFYYPSGVAVASSGNVFVADTLNNRIQKFDSSGGYITKWGSFGTGDGQFYYPSGVAVDSSGDVFAADTANNRIQKFDSSGTFITKWGSSGTGDGQFKSPSGVAVDSSGNVFVTDYGNHRIQKFDSSGTFITKWGSEGTGDGQFKSPSGVAVDSSGNVLVADTFNNRIQKFDSSGTFITKWGSEGTGDGQFKSPSGVAVDSSGDVFAADRGNYRIQKFGEGSAPPHVTGINPDYGYRGETLDDVSITGSDFRDVSMTVELQRVAETIGGTDVLYISDTEVTCDFDLTGASVGTWDVYLKHNDDDKSSTLDDAFFVHWPAISVSKTADPSSGAPSTDVTFTIAVTNIGDCTLDPVKVVDTLPSGMSYVATGTSPTPNTAVENADGTWTITWNNVGPLAKQGETGDSTTITLIAHIDGDVLGTLTDSVTATGTPPHGDDVSDTDTADVTAYSAGIDVEKTADPTSGAPSTNVTFTIAVTNTGDSTLDPVKVVDTLPSGMSYVATGTSPTPNNAVENADGTWTITWNNVGPLAKQGETGDSTTITLIAHIDGDVLGTLTDSVTATGTPPHGDDVSDTDTADVTAYSAGIDVEKTADPTSGAPSTNVTFTIAVTNTGDSTLDPVKVVDTLPSGMSYVATGTSPTPDNAVENADGTWTITWNNVGPLAKQGETGDSTTITLIAHIDGDVLGTLTDSVTATGTPPQGDDVEDTDTADVTAYSAGIDVEKTADPTSGAPSTNVTFTIAVTNTGDSTLDPVKVVDTLPSGMSYAGTSPTPDNAVENADGTWTITWNNVGPLAKQGETGDSTTITLIAHIDGDVLGTLTDSVTATGTPPHGDDVSDTDTADVTAYSAGIDVEKTADPTSGAPSTNVTFTIAVTNTGDSTLDPVKVVDTLPSGMSYVATGTSPTPDNAVENADGTWTITWNNVGPLAKQGETGDSTTITLIAHIDGDVLGTLTDSVTATGTPPHGDDVEDTDTADVTAYYGASIDVEKTADPTEGAPSTDVTFTITVTNTGDCTLDPVTVVDTLPSGMSYVATGTSPTPDNAVENADGTWTITWNNVGPLAKQGETGDSTTITLIAHIDGDVLGTLTDSVTATGTPPHGDDVSDTDTADVTAYSAGIDVEKTADPTSGAPSTTVTFTIAVTNTGDSTLDPVKVVDTLPSGMSYVATGTSPTPDNAVENADGTWTITWNNVGPLAKGETGDSTTITLIAHIDGDVLGTLTDSVTATGTPPHGDDVSDTDTADVTAYSAGIDVEKTADPTSGAPSTNVTFTIAVTNTGDSTLDPVKVVDTLPSGMSYVATGTSPTPDNAVENADGTWTITWNNVGPLAKQGETGDSTTITLIAHIDGDVLGTLTDSVTATGTPPQGDDVEDTDTADVTAYYGASIDVEKTADPTEGAPSTDVTFTITVTNTGDCTLDPVTVVDTLPGGMSYVSDDSGGSVSGQEITWDLGSMDSGASTTISLVAHIDVGPAGTLTNNVLATGTPKDSMCDDVMDSDTADVTRLFNPGISIVKTASLTGTCPGSDPLAVSIGDTVTYCFNVTNTGDVNLIGVTVNDDIYGSVTLGTTTLAPGETTEGTLTHVVVESDAPSVTDTATATGTDPLGGTVIDTDSCTINVEPSPCFIATAAYGTALHDDINVLREFRDVYLVTNPAGRVFVKIYYTTSPPVAALIRNNEGLSTSVREGFVKPLVYITRRFVKGGGQNG